MSNRQLLRSVAKARLKAMGVEHVNDCLNVGMRHTRNQNLQRTSRGRALLAKLQKKYPPHVAARDGRRPGEGRLQCPVRYR